MYEGSLIAVRLAILQTIARMSLQVLRVTEREILPCTWSSMTMSTPLYSDSCLRTERISPEDTENRSIGAASMLTPLPPGGFRKSPPDS